MYVSPNAPLYLHVLFIPLNNQLPFINADSMSSIRYGAGFIEVIIVIKAGCKVA